jgi:catechol 2,3-dioxygenase-like lactoylglutathione lyase family enzyme
LPPSSSVQPSGTAGPRKSDGHRRLRVRRICRARHPELLRACSPRWASPRSPGTSARTSPCTARATSTSSSTPSPAASPRIRARARPERLRHGVPGQGRQGGARPRAEARRDQRRNDVADGELDIPAIEGIGGSRLYLVDRYGDKGTIYDVDFDFFIPTGAADGEASHASHLTYIDHLTHNVNRGRMALGRLLRAALQLPRDPLLRHRGQGHRPVLQGDDQPCGKIRIPLNESQDDKSQIEEFLREYKGEGIQHIALGTDDIYETVDILRARGIPFQDTPDTYYELLDPSASRAMASPPPSSRSAAS